VDRLVNLRERISVGNAWRFSKNCSPGFLRIALLFNTRLGIGAGYIQTTQSQATSLDFPGKHSLGVHLEDVEPYCRKAAEWDSGSSSIPTDAFTHRALISKHA